MVKIRLTRMGNRKRPFYRVVVAEDSHRRDGRFIEIVGTYDPLARPAAIEVRAESVLKWLSDGAQPSDTVKQILKKTGVWAHWRAVQAGKAELLDLTGRQTGQLERNRPDRPSKKTVTKIAEQAEADSTAQEEAAAEPAEESSDENGTETEAAEESKP